MVLPPNLERYLPPYLWQKLKDAPGRGILLNALDRLRSVLYLLSTYLPSDLVTEKKRRPTPGLVRGDLLNGSLFFSDVSGFTALSERLATQGQEGAERLTQMINRYFDRMLEILAWSGGVLFKFAGDALLAYFPEQDANAQARWAVRAGHRMMRAMADFGSIATPLGPIALKMKIGISTGQLWAVSAGSAQRMEYVILGETVARTMAAEGSALAGQVMVDDATAAILAPAGQQFDCTPTGDPSQAPSFYIANLASEEALDDFEIKAEAKSRTRSAIPLTTDPEEIIKDMKSILAQIEALSPYLSTELFDRIIANAQQRQLESEYRLTTTLFINFTGFEPLFSAWEQNPSDAQRAAQLLSDYFNAMNQVITSYGGIVSRIDPYKQGSKMLVLFGAPVTHEDDPQRAVRAALAMNAKLAELNERWRNTLPDHWPANLGEPLIQQRIGITLGVTFAGQAGSSTRREYTVMGDDVNLSARLMSAAKPGQILLSQHVYKAVANHFDITSLPAIQVKGKSKLIPIYQADNLRVDRLAHRLQSQGPLLGRDAALTQGRQTLHHALAGHGTLLTIQGPAGIGKSHLADVLAGQALAESAKVFLCECAAYTSEAPYTPWIALVHSMAGIGSDDARNARSEKLISLLTKIGLTRDDYKSALFNLLGLHMPAAPIPLRASTVERASAAKLKPSLFDQLGQKVSDQGAHVERKEGLNLWQLTRERQQAQRGQIWQNLEARVTARERSRLFEGVCALLERLSAGSPLVILFENVQWMDSMSHELLDYMGERLKRWPVLIMAVRRSEEAQEASWSETLALGPLDTEGTKALITYLMGDIATQTDLTELVQAIHEQSGGNPLFIEETVRWLQRTGQNSISDLKAALRASSTLQELIISRLDSLPYARQNVAKAASVAGNEFYASDVGSLLESSESYNLDDSLAGLEEARLTLVAEPGFDARHAFRQTLIRELIYDSQSFARRRELHARLAHHLEAHYVNDLDSQAELLALHYGLADQCIPAARYLLISGHKARRRYAYPQATSYYSQALSALERLPAGDEPLDTVTLKAQAYEGQGDVALLTGDFVSAADFYQAARSILPPPPSVPPACGGDARGGRGRAGERASVQASLLLKHALVLPILGQAAKAEECARQAEAIQQAENDTPATFRLAATAIRAWLLWRAGDAEASDWVRQAANLASGTDRWTTGVAALLTDLAKSWAEAMQTYLALDQPIGAALAACRLGDQHLSQGDVAQALALYDQAADLWDQESDAYGLALAYYRQAEACWRQSDATTTNAKLREALGLLDAISRGNNYPASAPAPQHDMQAIQAALETVNANQTVAWSPWRWQYYDDAFRILALFWP